MLTDKPVFVSGLLSIQLLFSVLKKHVRIDQFRFSQLFIWVVHSPERTEKGLINGFGPDCRPCIASVAGS